MTQANENVGFIGIGLMGQGMAKNIVEKGYPLTVIAHRNRAPVEDLVARGATEAKSMEEMASSCTLIFLCLTGSPEVAAAVAALKPGLAKGSVIVDCSTSDPTVTQRIAAELAEIGVDFADAPLSRTPKEAWEGTLDCMVGADDAVFARIEPVIATWAAKIVHIGGIGDGHRMKLLNNFISLGYAALYSEALALSRKVGIPIAEFDKVIRGGRMDCGFYQTFMGYALEGNREAHKFTLGNAYKDMRYVESMANAVTVTTTMSSAVKNAFALAMANGGDGPEDYVPHLSDFIAKANGIA
ncbi:MAG: NAD(P)-dependent oxidoreductase [Desulfomicrobium sp.]|uniref:NAD(P)-dependent oxidoreductase n=1 Tax=Hoeflea sp. TaxID=1940281 RepID=UPI0025C29A1E|nr:NAD(P)-dependent oxidoreductase [Hoeflea sp.]MBU4528293.1 NAD(P)-dependent oxidoreductase [Alphaproteobacteria bacterium]MBV1713102.1 NAD(P)-dependent oxidoreductase [Desulfomicrobium sp.]MBU4546284.1 NAD(P)-dependent oxidoreductase [Alphaproteobacteria bacterium]MBU4548885.1 NAD(P)-dependent oxidoreductase [Alphaproteobacteria bacterium]MBV1781816.1 NAD(P)-dependent oxidoreductase [Hoeflea sp.]